MVGDGIRADFTVTGSAAVAPTSTDGTLAAAVTSYRRSSATRPTSCSTDTTKFVALVKAGKVDEAKALYPVRALALGGDRAGGRVLR